MSYLVYFVMLLYNSIFVIPSLEDIFLGWRLFPHIVYKCVCRIIISSRTFLTWFYNPRIIIIFWEENICLWRSSNNLCKVEMVCYSKRLFIKTCSTNDKCLFFRTNMFKRFFKWRINIAVREVCFRSTEYDVSTIRQSTFW